MKEETQPFAFAATGPGGEARKAVRIFVNEGIGVRVAAEALPAGSAAIGASQDGRRLFVGTTVEADAEQPNGGVQALSWEPETGKLQPLNTEATQGTTVCSIGVNPSWPLVACANYRLFGRFGQPGDKSCGSVSVHTAFPDGSISPVIQRLEYPGSGPNPARQEHSHPHMAGFDPSGGWLCVADLGIDAILLHRVADDGSEVALEPIRVAAPPGSGPRHFVFHPDGHRLFVLTEMSVEVLVFDFDSATGGCELRQKVSAKENGQGGGAADLRWHPGSKQLFASVRSGPFVTRLRWDAGADRLVVAGHEPVGGNPRAIFCVGDRFFAPAPEEAGLGIWRVEADGALGYLHHEPGLPVPNAYAALPTAAIPGFNG